MTQAKLWFVSVLVTLFAILLLVPSLGIESASSHTRVKGSKNKYMWGVGTVNRDYKQTDPINVVFLGGGPISYHMVRVMNNFSGELYDAKDKTIFGDSRQRVKWFKYCGGKICGRTYQNQDTSLATNNLPLAPRKHIRIWGDSVHSAMHGPNHNDRLFALGSAHPDHLGHKKRKPGDWGVGKRWAVKSFAGYCSWPRWRYRPLAERRYGGVLYNGIMARISSGKTPNCRGK